WEAVGHRLAPEAAGKTANEIRAEQVRVVDARLPSLDGGKIVRSAFQLVAIDAQRRNHRVRGLEQRCELGGQPGQVDGAQALPKIDLNRLEAVRQDLADVRRSLVLAAGGRANTGGI